MTSLGAEQGKFLLNFPKLSVYKKKDKDNDSSENVMDIDMVTDDDADPKSSTLSIVKYNATRTIPVTTVLSLNQWKQALEFIKEPTNSKMTELIEVFSTLPPVSSVQKPQVSVTLFSPFINVHYQMSFQAT